MTPQEYAQAAAYCNGVFADPKARTDAVLEAMVTYLTINNVTFNTASGEIKDHLRKAVNAMRGVNEAPKRRFFGSRLTDEELRRQSDDELPC